MHSTALIHIAATWALVGLIWVVQVVIYPIYARVPERGFRAYHGFYTNRIGLVVGALMGIEALTGALLYTHTDLGSARLALPTALLVFNWVATGLLFVPIHNRLAAGFDAVQHRRLVRFNWLRTAAWTARGVLVLGWLSG